MTIDQAFSPKNDLVDLARSEKHRKTEKEGQLADGRGGVREEQNHTMARKPGPL
jgi:hypothetical protein